MLIVGHTHKLWHHTLDLHQKYIEWHNRLDVPHAPPMASHATPASELPPVAHALYEPHAPSVTSQAAFVSEEP
jgi:hypothetical protein